MSRAGTVAIDVGGTFTDITFADTADRGPGFDEAEARWRARQS